MGCASIWCCRDRDLCNEQNNTRQINKYISVTISEESKKIIYRSNGENSQSIITTCLITQTWGMANFSLKYEDSSRLRRYWRTFDNITCITTGSWKKGMIMEAGLNWHRTLPSGMLRYEYGGWTELAQDIA